MRYVPQESFLEGLRELSDENGILLVFDEVSTEFRHNLGGVQTLEGDP